MAKRKRSVNYEKKLKDGFGQGAGIDYKPWLTIQDVPSLGRVTRLKGVKIPRQHEFLSDLERDYFYILEHSDAIIDIREQFALLPLESTIEIASEIGIKHPTHIKTKEMNPLSTDFFITVEIDKEIHYLARTVKPSDALMDKRVLEKFEIERIFWHRNNVDWGIVTEKEINKTLAANIASFREYHSLGSITGFNDLNLAYIAKMCNNYIELLVEYKYSVREIATEIEDRFILKPGCGLSLFKYMLANKMIKIPLLKEIDVDHVYEDIEVNEIKISKVMMG